MRQGLVWQRSVAVVAAADHLLDRKKKQLLTLKVSPKFKKACFLIQKSYEQSLCYLEFY